MQKLLGRIRLGGISMAPEVLSKVYDPHRRKAATLVEKMIQGNSATNTEVAGKDTGLGGMSMIPELVQVKMRYYYHLAGLNWTMMGQATSGVKEVDNQDGNL
ncbi:hypothetical protein C5167_043984 [Papaver somniferum]|uniref:Uncharacterized protein n=1 Tax=Papaver somniferum TaxID=3469 RepID=A0A4Y7LB38_PAPSO|nr:hypothetical protein C5167_043984 [Papaver somniferum]